MMELLHMEVENSRRFFRQIEEISRETRVKMPALALTGGTVTVFTID